MDNGPGEHHIVQTSTDTADESTTTTMTEANVLHSPLRRIPSGPERERYRPLFALADDSELQITGYYQTGDLYAFDDARENLRAIALVLPELDGVVEVKVIAVDSAYQGRDVISREAVRSACGCTRQRIRNGDSFAQRCSHWRPRPPRV
jgi:hypothetical protein